MCLIIDINIAHKMFFTSEDPDFCDAHKCLFEGNGKMVYGGKLNEEYRKSNSIRRILIELDRAGRAIHIDDGLVDAETEEVIATELCVSNDEHIIALARVSKVRLLCSNDQELHTDFTNKELVDKPRGKVYQTRRHNKLLRRFCDC